MTKNQRKLLFALGFLVMLGLGFSHLLTNPRPVSAFASGPPAGRTGAPGEGICLSCHTTYPLDDPSGGVLLDGLPESYVPGEPIDFTVTVFQDGTGGIRKDWGFQLTALDANNIFAGTLVASDATNTQVISGQIGGDTRFYIEHTIAGIFFNPEGAEMATWTITWVPPDEDVGPVTFYVAGNAANGDFNPEGDYIFTGNQTVSGPVSNASSARPSSGRERPVGQRGEPARSLQLARAR